VTAIQVRPTRVPSMVNFNLYWDWADAVEVMAAWQEWIVGGPRELGSRVWVAALDDAGPPRVLVHGSYLGTLADCERQLDRLGSLVRRPTTERVVEDLPHRAFRLSGI
jgi:hypothetical protein